MSNDENNQPVGQGPDTEQAVVGSGSVNFDSGLIPDAVAQATQIVEASAPTSDVTTIGNVRNLGHVPVTLKPEVQKPSLHTITASINLTLNTGFTLLRGLKELKSVDIERGSEDNQTIEKFNFYNPFLKSDKERQTGEGLLRKTFASIAELVHSVLGRECVYIGDSASITPVIESLISSVAEKMVAKWPLPADCPLLTLDLELADGSIAPREIKFGELFSLTSWTVSSKADENCVITHNAVFNIGLNVGALYDATEPQTFIRRALTFIETQLSAVGLTDLIDYHVNYAFDSSSLELEETRDLLDLMIGEDAFTVVSKAAVESGMVDWVPVNRSNSLFGFGCDILLRSPDVVGDEEDGDEVEGSEA